MIIKPIDIYTEDSSVNIFFSDCIEKLKKNNPFSYFTILQINRKNNNKKCLVDQVEYKIYNEKKQLIDLFVCRDVEIKIEYKIINSSLLDMEQVSYFKNKGVDIFNINDSFFQDI